MKAHLLIGVLAPALLVCAACRTGAGHASSSAASFPVDVKAARLVGTYISVEYTLTNDSAHPVWVGCPDFECAIPGTFGARVDGVSSEGTMVRLSSRLIAEPDGVLGWTWRELVPFRRVAPGATRWRAEFELTSAEARAIAAATGPVQVELAIGVLPCPDRELLPPVEGLGIHVVKLNLLLQCRNGEGWNGEQRAIDCQHLSLARGKLTIMREAGGATRELDTATGL